MNTPHLIEIALLMLAAFLIGCLIGYFLRRLISGDTSTATAADGSQTATDAPQPSANSANEAASAAAAKTAPPAKPATTTQAQTKTAAKPAAKKTATKRAAPAKTTTSKTAAAKPATRKPAAAKAASKAPAAADGKPETLAAPRGGEKDDLKNIKGIGPKIEGILNGMGIYHFDQVASWGRKEVKWIDAELSFKGRIDREKWIAQAKALAKGK